MEKHCENCCYAEDIGDGLYVCVLDARTRDADMSCESYAKNNSFDNV